MLIRTEHTPNPATRKFLPGRTVMETGTRDFADADSATA
ncbi:MAG: NifU N-terminal domain-containing protein, partial [Alphaproteobacteria bacterium]